MNPDLEDVIVELIGQPAIRRFKAVPLVGAAILAIATAAAVGARQIRSPQIRSVRPDRSTVAVFERLTLDVDLAADYDNPFDADQVALNAEILTPAGRRYTAPGFLYQPFRRDDAALRSRRTVPAGDPRWQLRLSFAEPGTHRIIVTLRDRQGRTQARPLFVTVAAADKPGMIRRSPADHRYFVTDRGESWFAVGANVCWGETWSDRGRHVFIYDEWFARYAQAGCNYARLWLAPTWNDLCLVTRESGFDRIDLQRAWHLDYVLERAEAYGLRLMVCIDSFNTLRSTQRQHGDWENSPVHPRHGGPVARPRDFFTNPTMRRAYENRLRYLVARYGYSPNVFAWEFFNEVDIIDDYDSRTVAAWHRDMARFLRDIDPYDHLITTSFARPQGDPAVDGLAEMDFVQSHHYQAPDIAAMLDHDLRTKAAACRKPHFHGEFGISHSGQETGRLDPAGVHLHNGLYAAVVQGHAGVPMTWWWDSYVRPRNLYPQFAALNRWIEGFDFVAQQPQPMRLRFEWARSADGTADRTGRGRSRKPDRSRTVVKRNSTDSTTVPLRAWGLLGRTRGLLWVQNPQHTWSRLAAKQNPPTPVRNARIVIEGIATGRWTVQTWDTRRGRVTAERVYAAGADRLISLDLPAITWDVAFRFQRSTASGNSD